MQDNVAVKTITVFFRLADPLPTWNTVMRVGSRMSMRQRNGIRKKMLTSLAMEIWGCILEVPGQRKILGTQPFARAKVRIERRSVGNPDPDAIWIKGLLDVLQPPSKRHPYGLGIIADDTDECLCGGAVVIRQRVEHRIEQCTMVTIEGEAEC